MGKSQIPIFVGGTGRSGTTIVGDLLGQHPAVFLSNPTEIKFFANRSGMLDLVFGRKDTFKQIPRFENFQSLQKRKKVIERNKGKVAAIESEFRSLLWDKWFEIDALPPHGPGLKVTITKEKLEKLLSKYFLEARINSLWAGRRFMKSYIDNQLQGVKPSYWIETTPMNISMADRIAQVFPNAFFINMVRDPRDVISSLLDKNWGPNTPEEGLIWIEKRLLADRESLSKIPASKQLTVHLEDLVINDRKSSYGKLLNFLELPDSDQMREFFNSKMSPISASSGRWRANLNNELFLEEYAKMVNRLEDAGLDFNGYRH
ncbi:MAG: sulfotransferase [Candidatus Nanopelagicaceae bacterium]|nr:sulfotransferase [Candidatus Nanopelagicaceae bacterium]